MKKMSMVLFVMAMMAGLTAGCGQKAEEDKAPAESQESQKESEAGQKTEDGGIVFKLGMVDPDGSNFHKGAMAIAEEVNKSTGGKITIQVFSGGQLGNERDMYEGAQMGTIDMFTASNAVLTSFIPEMAVLDQPFLFDTADQAHHVIDGTIGGLIADKTAAQNIHTMGWMDVGFRNIFSTRPVTSVADLKNLKIRTMENDIHIAAFNALGAIATPMASGDVFTGLQQGTIDAAENAISNLIANRYYEITKNVTWTNHVFGFMGVFMSDKAYNQIPEELREDFMAGVQAGAQKQREFLVEANDEAVKELTDMGVNFYEIPMDDMRKLVEPAMEQFADRMDTAWVNAIEAEK